MATPTGYTYSEQGNADDWEKKMTSSQGKAVLFMQQQNGRVSADEFFEEDHASPWHAAQNVRAACESDFPDAVWSVGQNERSRILMRNENMRSMGFVDVEYAEDALL